MIEKMHNEHRRVSSAAFLQPSLFRCLPSFHSNVCGQYLGGDCLQSSRNTLEMVGCSLADNQLEGREGR